MRFSERLGFGQQQYLFSRSENTEHDADLNRWTIAVPIALNAWLKETFDRKRSLGGVYTTFTRRNESWLTHVLEGIEFVGRMDIADRASNGLRLAVGRDNRNTSGFSEFGSMLHRAFNNPTLSDHNHEHSRRLERWLEAMMLNIGELRHSHTIFHWIDSTILFSYWHDTDQLLSLQRNLEERKELSVKKGHALAAAVMLLTLHKRYAIERKVSIHDAWEICAGAALMTLKHDEPERFTQALSGTKNAYSVVGEVRQYLHGDELERLYDANQLDIFTLTPGQLIELLRRIKQKNGFMDEGTGTMYGLLPAFEKEYAEELLSLESNFRPMIETVTDEEKMSFRLAATTAVMADVFDMVTPPVEALLRTMNTQYSRNRPFFRMDSPEVMLRYIVEEAGNVPSDVDSDTRRMLWQLMHLEHLKDSVVTGSTFVKSVNRDSALMGALAFRAIGSRLMRGDVSGFATIYAKRKEAIAQKALSKENIPLVQAWRLMSNFRRSGDVVTLTTALEQRGRKAQAERLRQKFTQLDAESVAMVHNISQKPAMEYTEKDIGLFQNICDEVIEKLMKKYAVNTKRLKRYRAKLARGRYPGITPYVTYDSLGGIPRTLVKPIS